MRRGSQFLLVALTGPWLLTGAGHAAPELPVMAYQPGINPQAFLPISYQCPTGKNGVVEVVKMSSVGGRIKVRVTFEGESATHASVQRAWRDKSFEGWHEFTNPRKKPDSDAERTILQTALTEADSVRMAICIGVPATREKYDAILEHNRRHLRPPPD